MGAKAGIKNEKDQALVARDMVKLIEDRSVTGWTERDDIQKEMRRELKRYLRNRGCPEEELPPMVREIMELAQHILGRW